MRTPHRVSRIPLFAPLMAAALAAGASPALLAQSTDGLEEIVVTARKRAETLETAPVAIKIGRAHV